MPVRADNVHQSVDVDGEYGDCECNTRHAISLAVVRPGGDYSMPTVMRQQNAEPEPQMTQDTFRQDG
jgi:hypothetical protein